MAADSNPERTELPLQRQANLSRQEGQGTRSKKLSASTVLLASAATLWFSGASLIQQMKESLRVGLTLDKELVFNTRLIIIPIGAKST